jgi:hypothetical protein
MVEAMKVTLEELRWAVNQIHNCQAHALIAAVEVEVPQEGTRPWRGTVHEFAVTGHPRASRCFVFPVALNPTTIVIRAVMSSPRIKTAEHAVRHALRGKRRR